MEDTLYKMSTDLLAFMMVRGWKKDVNCWTVLAWTLAQASQSIGMTKEMYMRATSEVFDAMVEKRRPKVEC